MSSCHFSCFRVSHNFLTNAILLSQSGGRNLSGFGLAIFKQSLAPMGRFRNNDVDSETLCKQASEDNCIGFPLQDYRANPHRDHRADPHRADPHRADPHRADPHRADPHRADPHRANDEAPEYAYFVHEQALLRIKGV